MSDVKQPKNSTATNQPKIKLKKLKSHGTIWHPESRLVFQSSTEMDVIGRLDDEGVEIIYDDEIVPQCIKWGFRYNDEEEESVKEEEESGEEEDEQIEAEDKQIEAEDEQIEAVDEQIEAVNEQIEAVDEQIDENPNKLVNSVVDIVNISTNKAKTVSSEIIPVFGVVTVPTSIIQNESIEAVSTDCSIDDVKIAVKDKIDDPKKLSIQISNNKNSLLRQEMDTDGTKKNDEIIPVTDVAFDKVVRSAVDTIMEEHKNLMSKLENNLTSSESMRKSLKREYDQVNEAHVTCKTDLVETLHNLEIMTGKYNKMKGKMKSFLESE